jgi:hypothetical protein
MRHNEALIFTVRAQAVTQILEVIQDNCPAKRETAVQVAKLERMIEDFRNAFTFGQVHSLAGNTKSVNKKIGAAIYKLNQQAKKTSDLLNKSLEQDFFTNAYPGTTATRKDFRAQMRDANRILDQSIHKAAQKFRQEILSAVAERQQLKQ